MNFNKLSIIIPVFNEQSTIIKLLNKVIKVRLINNIKKEIIIVDDGSNDNTNQLINDFIKQNYDKDISYFKQEINKGKGAAIQTGINNASGDYIIIQDADLEYDPNEYNLLINPVIEADAEVVYGTRFMGGNPHRILFFWHSLGNKFLTFLSNMFSNLNLSDMEAGLKLFKTDIIKKIRLQEKGFGFEPEITAKIAKIPDIKIYEVGISYYGRTYKEGKKIKWRDGVRAVYCILRYNIFVT